MLEDLIKKISKMEETLDDVKETLNDMRVSVSKAVEILENVNDDDLYITNQELSIDLDNVIEILSDF